MTTVVVGSGVDATLEQVASALAGDAVVLRPADLSRSGWCLDPEDPMSGTFVAGGDTHANREVTTVVMTIRGIAPGELSWFGDPDDRRYVSAEMSALLRAWLRTYPRHLLIGAPHGPMLAGASWNDAQWRRVVEMNSMALVPSVEQGADWVCHASGEVRSTDPRLETAAARIIERAPINYLWVEADRTGESPVVRSIRDHPRFDDVRERDAIISLLNGVRP